MYFAADAMACTVATTQSFMLPINLILYITAAYNNGNAHAHLNW